MKKNIFELNHKLHILFAIVMLAAVLLSFYFFIMTIILKQDKHRTIFTTWQFPMLLSIFLDVIVET
jgi:hypothetical protein